MPSVPVLLYHHGNDTSIAIYYRRPTVCLILCNTFSQILRNLLWDSLYLYYTEIQKVKEPAQITQLMITQVTEKRQVHLIPKFFPLSTWPFWNTGSSLNEPCSLCHTIIFAISLAFLWWLADWYPSPKIWLKYHLGVKLWVIADEMEEKIELDWEARNWMSPHTSHLSLLVYKTRLITHTLPTTWSFGEDQMDFVFETTLQTIKPHVNISYF